jgi:NitT/TauT family transport system substrate-binding protein
MKRPYTTTPPLTKQPILIRKRWVLGAMATFAAACIAATQVRAEVNEIKITKQPGMLYSQIVIMEHRKLLEKQAAAMGIGELKPSWIRFSSGGAATDALLSGSVDIVTSGVSNMLLLWGRTNGEVKGVAACGGTPIFLMSRNPDVKTIKDFGPKDRIALPTIKVSMQATILGMALEKVYPGEAGAHEKLLTTQVQLGHPEATAAVTNPTHEINAHFSNPPYQQLALKTPGVRTVLDSLDVMGGAHHITAAFATTKFRDANPKVMKAFLAAFDEASAIIKNDPRGAAESYLAITGEKFTVEELAALYAAPNAVFDAAPKRTMMYAEYMNRVGYIKQKATSWKDFFFSDIHDRDGS